eukprot:COSAG06_NODE_4685_length_4037_cov_1.889030_2_plen_93_part_00
MRAWSDGKSLLNGLLQPPPPDVAPPWVSSSVGGLIRFYSGVAKQPPASKMQWRGKQTAFLKVDTLVLYNMSSILRWSTLAAHTLSYTLMHSC